MASFRSIAKWVPFRKTADYLQQHLLKKLALVLVSYIAGRHDHPYKDTRPYFVVIYMKNGKFTTQSGTTRSTLIQWPAAGSSKLNSRFAIMSTTFWWNYDFLNIYHCFEIDFLRYILKIMSAHSIGTGFNK